MPQHSVVSSLFAPQHRSPCLLASAGVYYEQQQHVSHQVVMSCLHLDCAPLSSRLLSRCTFIRKDFSFLLYGHLLVNVACEQSICMCSCQ